MSFSPEVVAAMDHLVATGAEIEIRTPDGEVTHRAPLARQWRQGTEDRLVVRLIHGDGHLDDGRPVFGLNSCGARHLRFERLGVLGPEYNYSPPAIGCWLPNGDGFAIVRATSSPGHADALARWDRFWSEVLTDGEREELGHLEVGDWVGNWDY